MMWEQEIQKKGKQKGPISIILVGVHGNEQNGVRALENILPTLQIEKGCVFFAYGNPKAIEKNKRFTEANLNRMFKSDAMLLEQEKVSDEYARAQFLKTYFHKASALLDIHASMVPNSTPFAICEANAHSVVEYLPISRVVSGFDKVEPGGTDYYMNSIGNIGLCVECGYLGNPQAIQTAEESIIAFLKARGHMANDLRVRKQTVIRMYDLYITKTNLFTLAQPFADFEEIASGQLIGKDGQKEIRAKTNSIILFAHSRNKMNEEAFLLGQKERAW